MPNFEVFSRHPTPAADTPFVTIQKRGAISLSKTAFALLGEPEAVELLFDRAARIVGLRAAPADTAHAYLVRAAAAGRGPYLISAVAFTKFYNINTDQSTRWQATLAQGVLCVELTHPPLP